MEAKKEDKVEFNIAHGLTVGTGIIKEIKKDSNDENNQVYRVDCAVNDNIKIHLNKQRELWINDFEISYIIKNMYKIVDEKTIILSENCLNLYNTKKSALWYILQMLVNDSDVEQGYTYLNENKIDILEKWIKENFDFVLEEIQIKIKK